MKALTSLSKQLLQAHKRSVSTSQHRVSNVRTPTTLFDAELIKYFKSKLTDDELHIERTNGQSKETFHISEFNENTRFNRTDVTQLCSLVFKKYKLTDPSDGRKILYSKDPQLVKLLTTGSYKPEMEEKMQSIRNGTYELSIFTIQGLLNHRLKRYVAPVPVQTETTVA